MPLILAIEPDRRQAAQITAVVRGRLRADLVLADSAERALAALGERVPDLILTSALLSPKDEAALGERLRALDGTAAHVHTLTIPVLAGSAPRSNGASRGGVLSVLLGDKAKDESPDGCDPAIFAEQCREYLDRAAADRAQASDKGVAFDGEATAARTSDTNPRSASDASSWDASNAFSWRASASTARSTGSSDEPHAAPAADAPQDFTFDAPVQPAAETMPPELAEFESALTAAHAEKRQPPTTARRGKAPASLIAAMAAFEAEEQLTASHVEPAAPSYVEPPVASKPIEHHVEPVVASRIEPPAASPIESPDDFAITEPFEVVEESATEDAEPEPHDAFDLDLDLSMLLSNPSPMKPVEAVNRSDYAVEVYDIDTATLDAIAPLVASAPASKPAPIADTEQEPAPILSETELYTALSPSTSRWPSFGTPGENAEKAEKPANGAPPNSGNGGSREPDTDEVAEWSDIIEALKRDAERAHTPKRSKGRKAPKEDPPAAKASDAERTPAVTAPPPPESAKAAAIVAPAGSPEPVRTVVVATPPEPVRPDANGSKKKRRRSQSVQDEWGFFDPQQCGLQALMAKLEEITTQEEGAAPVRRPTDRRRPL